MGRKLAPLRKILGKSNNDQSSGDASKLGKRTTGPQTGSNIKGKKSQKVEEEDDVDWEKVEAEAEQHGDNESASDSDEDEDGSEDGDGIRLDGNLEHVVEDFTFEFNDMRDDYSEGICTMLRKLISNPTDAYSLATVVTSQTIVGTVVNSEGATDSFAFATILPFHKLEKLNALRSIFDCLAAGLDKHLAGSPDEEMQLLRDCIISSATALTGGKGTLPTSASGSKSPKPTTVHAARTGMLLHKRFSNLPIQLVGALHRNLEEDVSWAQQQATDDDELVQESASSSSSGSSSSSSAQKGSKPNAARNFFADARNVVLLCECAVTKEGKSSYALSESGPVYNVLGSCSDIIFSCFEDEVYLQHATAAVLFRPPGQVCGMDLVALLVPISKLQKCANGICELIPE